MSLNPYQSPLATDGPPPPRPPGVVNPGLVRTSLGLAVFIEILPFEADLTFFAWSTGNIPLFLLLRGICLAVVLGPLLYYIRLNGKAGIKRAWGQITFIAVVLGLKLALEAWAIVATLCR